MTVKSDKWIIRESMFPKDKDKPLISPFEQHELKEEGVLSYGVSSGGYDARLASEFKCGELTENYNFIDPKDKNCFEDTFYSYNFIETNSFYIESHQFVLARTLEYFRMPDDVIGFVFCKSTYARCGIFMPPTVIEPAWEGTITLELANMTNFPVRLYPNEGIALIVFMDLDEVPNVTYATRHGKYQFQQGVTLPRIKGFKND